MPLVALALAAAAIAWRTPDPENTLLVETTRGRVVVELRPELAPNAVARIKALARAHTYDGLLFHRVIAGFVAQTGNPNNRDGGATDLPNLKPEFRARLDLSALTPVRRAGDLTEAMLGAMPVAVAPSFRQPPRTDGKALAWGIQCKGVLAMGRQAPTDTANSEIYFTLAPTRFLDGDYTSVGRVLAGEEALAKLAVGEPPAAPDRMTAVRVLADLAPGERPRIQVENERSPAFAARIARLRRAKGADLSACDVPITTRIE